MKYIYTIIGIIISLVQIELADISLNSYTFTEFKKPDSENPNINIDRIVKSLINVQNTNSDNVVFVKESNVFSTQAENIAKAILGRPLNFPNPVNKGRDTTLGYNLSKEMDIEILIYDSTGYLIFETTIQKGAPGAQAHTTQYNKVPLRDYGFYTENLSVGIYFYIIKSDHEILGKGKLALVP